MYLDLLSTGMNEALATQFYEEIRCMSRANIFPVPELKAWEVCFSKDYSEAIGTLLAKYVHRDTVQALDEDTMNTTSRFVFGRARKFNRGPYLRSLFGDARRFRRYSGKKQGTCCKRCRHRNYFVNIEHGQCLRNPFGKHCCHKACKSLGRLKIGASSSVSFCCRNCNPRTCARN